MAILDEAYGPFGGPSAVPHIHACPNLLTVHSLSKGAALAGLRVGFAIGPAPLLQGLRRIRDSVNSYTLDRLAQAGAVAAVRDLPYYAELTRQIVATRERAAARLKALGFEVVPSQANFVFARHPRRSGAELCAALREQGILVRRFDAPRIRDYLRITIGTDADMNVFLDVLEHGELREPPPNPPASTVPPPLRSLL